MEHRMPQRIQALERDEAGGFTVNEGAILEPGKVGSQTQKEPESPSLDIPNPIKSSLTAVTPGSTATLEA